MAPYVEPPYCNKAGQEEIARLRTDLKEAVEAVRLCQAALLVTMEGRGYSGRELEALGAAKRVLDKCEPKS